MSIYAGGRETHPPNELEGVHIGDEDPGDPFVVAEHRREAEEGLFSARLFGDRHERVIRLLAMFLEKERLHVGRSSAGTTSSSACTRTFATATA